MQQNSSISGLYAITPDSTNSSDLLQRVESCLKGGARVIQYRNKQAAPHRENAEGIAALCRRYAAVFIVNDDMELALAVDADGVHLGRDDGDIAQARERLGADKLIGVSCYASLERAREAEAAGANYVAFGSLFPSPTKPQAPLAPLTLLGEARAKVRLPIIGIGGITLDNATEAIVAGADALAVISAVFDAPDVERAARDFSNLFSPGTS